MIIFWIIGLNKNIADLFLFFYVASTDGYKAALLVKNTPANAGDTGGVDSIPGSGGSPGERNGKPLQCSCLENPMDRGAWLQSMGLQRVRQD